jgi:hypothetical protein
MNMRRNFLKSLAAVTASVFCLKPSVAKPVGEIVTFTSGDKTYFTCDGEVYKIVAKHYTKWVKNGTLHREDGPALEYTDGNKYWYRHGKLHREDGPACEQNGSKEWYRHGKLHREDGPACEYVDGSKAWYRDGKAHRENMPPV